MKLVGLLLCLLLAPLAAAAQPAPGADTPAAGERTLRVLLVGNSLSYVNNLPGLLRSLARAQERGPRIETRSYLLPGADLQQHLRQGKALAALQAQAWDVLVLQERGGLLACLDLLGQREQPECRNSVRAHKRFVEAAQEQHTQVILLGTWGPDGSWQDHLDRALRQLARETGATPLYAGARLRAFQARHRDMLLFTDESLHPTLRASLIVTAALYRQLAGRNAEARPMLLDFPLLPPGSGMGANEPLEENAALNALARPVVLAASELPPFIAAAEPPP